MDECLSGVREARAASRHDPRHRPLTLNELRAFRVTVTVVERQQPIMSVSGLTAADGLVVTNGVNTGVVLPWEGKDPQTRLAWAYRKAGLAPGSPAQLSLLIAKRFRG